MIYLKTMQWLKKFWITFLSFLPFGAAAVSPWIVGAVAGVGAIAGFSIYRSMAPVDMADALRFFSSCWTCQMFSDIMATMSQILPRAYHGIGTAIIPFSIAVTAIWAAWQIIKTFSDNASNGVDGWSLANTFTTHFVKLAVVAAVLLAPLPRLMTDIVIEPIFNVGLYMNRAVTGDEAFNSCLVATAIADPVSATVESASTGAFSPKLRHNLACQVANVHQMTGVGMTVGWTMMNMAFNDEYQHKILWGIPFFPNVPIFFAGLLVMVLFFVSLLPIPLYFLEIFIKLSMDLVLLPLTFLGWLFKGWNIFPQGSHNKNIRAIVNDVINGTAGIAVTGIFVSFAIMFINAVFGHWNGAQRLALAIESGDSKLLMDGLMMRNDSLVTIILMGVFIAMFMTSIPALTKTLFNVSISTKYYDNLKKDLTTTWTNLKKIWSEMKK